MSVGARHRWAVAAQVDDLHHLAPASRAVDEGLPRAGYAGLLLAADAHRKSRIGDRSAKGPGQPVERLSVSNAGVT